MRFLTLVLAGGLLTAVLVASLVPQVEALLSAHQVAPVPIDLDPLAQRSIVLAADGRELAALHREQNRQEIPLDEVPQDVVDIILAIEDADFYEHGGVNLRAALRALFTNVQAGDVRQGGSTITQQLVKNALLTAEQDLDRKAREAVLAVRLENQLSKDEILERYLNTVYLGNGSYGLQAGAETYFGVDASDLTKTQASLLVGLIKNPVGLDPFRYPEAAEQRRADVVRRLVEVDLLTEAEAAGIVATPLPLERHLVVPKPDDYFVNEVVQRLLDDERLGTTRTERYNALFKGGLTIKTTLDLDAQQHAVAAVYNTLPDTGGKFTAALVSIEPDTGAVRALVGGPGFEQSKYNIATQGLGRQAGSSFKPFVLAAAIEADVSPKSRINGAGPCKFDNPGGTPDPYIADNYEGRSGGVSDLYSSTRQSINCAFIRLGLYVGIDRSMAMAERLGITTELRPVLSSPLGANEVRPIDMASAYATFANDGFYNEPYFVEEVLDRRGRVIFRQEPEPRRVISQDTARLVTDVLEGVVTSGTGTRARFADRRPAAGKTGTTQANTDAWFVGYTPQLSTAVWMGSPIGKVEMRGVGGVRGVTGGTFPARIWQAFMGPVHESLPIEQFGEPPPAGRGVLLEVDRQVDLSRPPPAPPAAPTTTTVPGLPPVTVPTTVPDPKPEKPEKPDDD